MKQNDFLEKGTDVQQGCFDNGGSGTLKGQGYDGAGRGGRGGRAEEEGQVVLGWGDVQDLRRRNGFAPPVKEEGVIDGVALCVCECVCEERRERVKR